MDKVDEFIEQHNKKYINYCEILILEDGTPVYANPSHQYKLMEIYGVPREQYMFASGEQFEKLQKEMPLSASPLHWLVEKTKTVAVWYEFLVFPLNYTGEQLNTVIQLIEGGCISKRIKLDVSEEYSYFVTTDNLICVSDKLSKRDYQILERDAFSFLHERSKLVAAALSGILGELAYIELS